MTGNGDVGTLLHLQPELAERLAGPGRDAGAADPERLHGHLHRSLDRAVRHPLLDRLGPADVEHNGIPGRARLARRLEVDDPLLELGREGAGSPRASAVRAGVARRGAPRPRPSRPVLARRHVAPDRDRDRRGERHLLGPRRLEARRGARPAARQVRAARRRGARARTRYGTTRTGRCCRRSPGGRRTRPPSTRGCARAAGRRSRTTPRARRDRRRPDAPRTRRRCRSHGRPASSTRITATSRSQSSSGFQPRIVPPSTRWRRLTVSSSTVVRPRPSRAGRSVARRFRRDRDEQVADRVGVSDLLVVPVGVAADLRPAERRRGRVRVLRVEQDVVRRAAPIAAPIRSRDPLRPRPRRADEVGADEHDPRRRRRRARAPSPPSARRSRAPARTGGGTPSGRRRPAA